MNEKKLSASYDFYESLYVSHDFECPLCGERPTFVITGKSFNTEIHCPHSDVVHKIIDDRFEEYRSRFSSTNPTIRLRRD